jgi:hypothetical protein
MNAAENRPEGRRAEAWGHTREAMRGLLRLCVVILAALLGALTVEAIRAIFF